MCDNHPFVDFLQKLEEKPLFFIQINQLIFLLNRSNKFIMSYVRGCGIEIMFRELMTKMWALGSSQIPTRST